MTQLAHQCQDRVAQLAIVINVGSASVKLHLYRFDGAECQALQSVNLDPAEAKDNLFASLLADAGATVNELCCCVHRYVHGGEVLTAPALVDDALLAALPQTLSLAPLHNQPAFEWLERAMRVLHSHVCHALVPDTGFFRDLPAAARRYALPKRWEARFELRRYGFHGIAHASLAERWHAQHPDRPDARLITLHLGGGASAAAIRAGFPLDTTMGFTPLEGLIMSTRCGDLDPGLLLHLIEKHDMPASKLANALNTRAGLAGLSGISGDMRALLASDDPRAEEAVDCYCHRLRKAIGAYLAVLSGADAIIFSGGIGVHQPRIRARALQGLEWAGIQLDADANAQTTASFQRVDAHAGHTQIWVQSADEASHMLRDALPLLESRSLKHDG